MNAVFDLGGTYLRCGIDAGTESLRQVERIRIAGLPWSAVATSMRAYVSRAAEGFGDIERIAFAFPGPIDDRGVPLTAPTLGLETVPVDISQIFAGVSQAPVHVLNDVSAAAWYVAQTCGDDRFIVVTVSSGIGSKVCDRTRTPPVLDDAPFAGEIGHLTVDFSDGAPVCDCGERGHLGGIASGRGIERHVRAAALARGFKDAATLTNEEHIAPAVRGGDAWTLARIREASAPLAAALATVVQSCGLQRIFIIGGFARMAGTPYVTLLEEEVLRCFAPARFGKPPAPLVCMPDTDDDACLRGAAVFARAQEPAACVSLS
jgi:glucokinase